ncbi:transmembrane protein 70 homolog, mitochondrial-like [Ruditapes philippinarum]|uniref:transmembrane protein 70 homolog, mitochondrial-like n=1 Tax=Ruditapes philippinarum TaxID=129788 RepID=UPI00295BC1E5|nr:transmembrane protein 70 homolog, mitochondrial-like [Ruditapes philippinarum]
MAALARLGHHVKSRLPVQVVRGGLINTRIRINSCASLHFSPTSNYHHLQSHDSFSKSQQTKNVDSRALQTEGSNNKDEESGMPLMHPTRGVLVYTGKLTTYVKGLKMFSLSTSFLALLAQPMVLSAAKDDLLFKAGLMGSISAALFSTPVLLHFVTKKYVTDIYFNEENKMFTVAYKSFFLRRKEMQFNAEDVVVPFTPRMFVTHIIKGKSFFIVMEEFRDKEIYKHMVGYDKPMDYGMDDQNKQTTPVRKKNKKFGLFNEEDEKSKQVVDKEPRREFMSKQLMLDDDDDVVQHTDKQKQSNKMR